MADKKNIYQRLHAAMADVSYVQKESKMVNNQYTFVSHDAVTRITREALMKHGVIYHPLNLQATQNGNRTEVVLDLVFVNIDNPEDRVTVPSLGFGIDPQDKGPGKAISYAVKYALLKALALETGDDPERDMIDHKPNGGSKPVGKSCVADGNHRSGNKAVDKAVTDAIGHVDACVDMESLEKVYKYQWKFLKDSGAHDNQLEMLTMQKDNVKTRLQAKGMN